MTIPGTRANRQPPRSRRNPRYRRGYIRAVAVTLALSAGGLTVSAGVTAPAASAATGVGPVGAHRSGAAAQRHRRCGPLRGRGTLPAPPPGLATTVDVRIGTDCAAHVSAVRLAPLATVPHRPANRGPNARAGSAPTARATAVSGAQHGVYQRVWDCCGILMNEFDTIAYWQYNGSWVTYWSLHNAISYHRELVGGWSLQYQNAWQQWSNGYQVNLAGDAGFSYQGLFDPTGTRYYNTYFNAIQVRGNGSWSCQWSYAWRNGFTGWHVQNWCS